MLSTGQKHSQPSASPWGQEDTKGSAMPLTGGGILGGVGDGARNMGREDLRAFNYPNTMILVTRPIF